MGRGHASFNEIYRALGLKRFVATILIRCSVGINIQSVLSTAHI